MISSVLFSTLLLKCKLVSIDGLVPKEFSSSVIKSENESQKKEFQNILPPVLQIFLVLVAGK